MQEWPQTSSRQETGCLTHTATSIGPPITRTCRCPASFQTSTWGGPEVHHRLNKHGRFTMLSPNFRENTPFGAYCRWCSEYLDPSEFKSTQLRKGTLSQVCRNCQKDMNLILDKKQELIKHQESTTAPERRCTECREMFAKEDFTGTQNNKRKDKRKCKDCTKKFSHIMDQVKKRDHPKPTAVCKCP